MIRLFSIRRQRGKADKLVMNRNNSPCARFGQTKAIRIPLRHQKRRARANRRQERAIKSATHEEGCAAKILHTGGGLFRSVGFFRHWSRLCRWAARINPR